MSTMDLQDYLTGHPIFVPQNSFDSSLNLSFDISSLTKTKAPAKRHASTTPLRQSIVAFRESDLLIAVGSEVRITSLLDARNVRPHERMYKTLYTPNIEFQIRQLALNANGKLLALAGHTEVAVITLPKTGYHKLVPTRLDCRTVQIGQFYHATRFSSPVVKMEWHPWGKNHCTLLVVTADGILREYDISVDPEEPRQVLSFMPERSHSSSFKRDSSSREIVSFCLGGGKADWGPLTIYALAKSGDVWAICPYIPCNAMIPSSYIHALDYFVRVKQENALQMSNKGQLDSNSFSVIYAQQLKYVNSIMKQLPETSSSLFAMSDKSVPITAPIIKNRPARQGPFLLQPSPVEFNEGDGGNATDIFYLYSTSGSPLFSDEDENKEGLGVILLTYSDGRVDVCLDTEKIEAMWESSPSASTSLPALVVYETIDLCLSSLIKRSGSTKAKNENKSGDEDFSQLLGTNWPVMMTDPMRHDTVFIYHSFGVHSLYLTPWLRPLIQSMQTGIDDRIESVVKKNLATEVTCVLDTTSIGAAKSDSIFGIALPSDIYLSYCLVAITQSLSPHTIELSFRLRNEETTEKPDMKQKPDLPSLDAFLEAIPGLQTKDSSLLSLLSQEPYTPPSVVSLPETIEAIRKLGRPLPDAMKRNLVITPELLREFATIVQRFQSYIRDIYIAVSNFQDRMILQDQEFQRQQAKYMEILQRVKKLKEEDNIKLRQRFERCFAEQKRLLSVSDKVLQKFMDANSPTLSEQEKKWFAELRRMKMEVVGETSYDSSSVKARTDTLSHKLEYYLPKLRDLALKEEQRKKELNGRPVELGKAQEYQILMRLGEHKQVLSRTIDRLQEMAQKLNIEIENVPEL